MALPSSWWRGLSVPCRRRTCCLSRLFFARGIDCWLAPRGPITIRRRKFFGVTDSPIMWKILSSPALLFFRKFVLEFTGELMYVRCFTK
jgi:hypothetical protein